ncbi:hypothetical protein BGZ94_008058 [Podila epigama]|nr:hypothetical protein BGZ94_008058 [Podila epigama]
MNNNSRHGNNEHARESGMTSEHDYRRIHLASALRAGRPSHETEYMVAQAEYGGAPPIQYRKVADDVAVNQMHEYSTQHVGPSVTSIGIHTRPVMRNDNHIKLSHALFLAQQQTQKQPPSFGHAHALPAHRDVKIKHHDQHVPNEPTDHHNHYRHQCDSEECMDHDASHDHRFQSTGAHSHVAQHMQQQSSPVDSWHIAEMFREPVTWSTGNSKYHDIVRSETRQGQAHGHSQVLGHAHAVPAHRNDKIKHHAYHVANKPTDHHNHYRHQCDSERCMDHNASHRHSGSYVSHEHYPASATVLKHGDNMHEHKVHAHLQGHAHAVPAHRDGKQKHHIFHVPNAPTDHHNHYRYQCDSDYCMNHNISHAHHGHTPVELQPRQASAHAHVTQEAPNVFVPIASSKVSMATRPAPKEPKKRHHVSVPSRNFGAQHWQSPMMPSHSAPVQSSDDNSHWTRTILHHHNVRSFANEMPELHLDDLFGGEPTASSSWNKPASGIDHDHAHAVPAHRDGKLKHHSYHVPNAPTDHHNHYRHQCDSEYCMDHNESHAHHGRPAVEPHLHKTPAPLRQRHGVKQAHHANVPLSTWGMHLSVEKPHSKEAKKKHHVSVPSREYGAQLCQSPMVASHPQVVPTSSGDGEWIRVVHQRRRRSVPVAQGSPELHLDELFKEDPAPDSHSASHSEPHSEQSHVLSNPGHAHAVPARHDGKIKHHHNHNPNAPGDHHNHYRRQCDSDRCMDHNSRHAHNSQPSAPSRSHKVAIPIRQRHGIEQAHGAFEPLMSTDIKGHNVSAPSKEPGTQPHQVGSVRGASKRVIHNYHRSNAAVANLEMRLNELFTEDQSVPVHTRDRSLKSIRESSDGHRPQIPGHAHAVPAHRDTKIKHHCNHVPNKPADHHNHYRHQCDSNHCMDHNKSHAHDSHAPTYPKIKYETAPLRQKHGIAQAHPANVKITAPLDMKSGDTDAMELTEAQHRLQEITSVPDVIPNYIEKAYYSQAYRWEDEQVAREDVGHWTLVTYKRQHKAPAIRDFHQHQQNHHHRQQYIPKSMDTPEMHLEALFSDSPTTTAGKSDADDKLAARRRSFHTLAPWAVKGTVRHQHGSSSGHAQAVPAHRDGKIKHHDQHIPNEPTDHHNHYRHQCDSEECMDHDASHDHRFQSTGMHSQKDHASIYKLSAYSLRAIGDRHEGSTSSTNTSRSRVKDLAAMFSNPETWEHRRNQQHSTDQIKRLVVHPGGSGHAHAVPTHHEGKNERHHFHVVNEPTDHHNHFRHQCDSEECMNHNASHAHPVHSEHGQGIDSGRVMHALGHVHYSTPHNRTVGAYGYKVPGGSVNPNRH